MKQQNLTTLRYSLMFKKSSLLSTHCLTTVVLITNNDVTHFTYYCDVISISFSLSSLGLKGTNLKPEKPAIKH